MGNEVAGVVSIDGVDVVVYEGETVAAVLIRGGRLGWRETRFGGSPRGVFCGIGICHDCLVTVDGVQGVRACIALARDGDVIDSATGGG